MKVIDCLTVCENSEMIVVKLGSRGLIKLLFENLYVVVVVSELLPRIKVVDC